MRDSLTIFLHGCEFPLGECWKEAFSELSIIGVIKESHVAGIAGLIEEEGNIDGFTDVAVREFRGLNYMNWARFGVDLADGSES